MKRMTVLAGLLTVAGSPLAHPGHGIDAAAGHWHASDLWGLALALAVGAGLWWWGRRP